MRSCTKKTKWGKCQQPRKTELLCLSHDRWLTARTVPDAFYEEKLVKGLITPVDEYMTPAEIEATLNGRYRGDGRRIDQFVSDDPLGWNPVNRQKNRGLCKRSPGMAAWLRQEGLNAQ